MATKEKIEELEKIPGIFKRREYGIWKSMLEICYDPSNSKYKSFGGRGVKVCKLWQEKKGSRGYLHFIGDLGLLPGDGFFLKRINPRGDFKPSNCFWVNSNGDLLAGKDVPKYTRNMEGYIQITIMEDGLFKDCVIKNNDFNTRLSEVELGSGGTSRDPEW